MNDYPKSLEIFEESSPQNHADLMTCYHSIDFLYQTMDNYLKAGSFYEKAFAIQQQSIPPKYLDLVKSYYRIDRLYDQMGDRTKASSFYRYILEMEEYLLGSNQPHVKRNL
jgi:tetratricopeptide (TPR) repeat protein